MWLVFSPIEFSHSVRKLYKSKYMWLVFSPIEFSHSVRKLYNQRCILLIMAKLGDINLRMSPAELRSVLIASLFIGFAVSYNDWGFGDSFIPSVGLINLFIATLVCAFTIWLRTNMQKRAAKMEMTTVTFRTNHMNFVYTIILSFLTSGFFVFAATGRPKVRSVLHLRPGYREPHLSPFRVGRIVAVGTVASFALIVIAKVWLASGGGLVASYLLRTNIWIALVSLIPLSAEGIVDTYKKFPLTKIFYNAYPKISKFVKNSAPVFEGEQIFFGGRALWVLLVAAAVLLSGLVKTGLSATSSLILSALVAFAVAIIWVYYVEFRGHKK